MVPVELEPWAARWKAQTNPLSYGGTPIELLFREAYVLMRYVCILWHQIIMLLNALEVTRPTNDATYTETFWKHCAICATQTNNLSSNVSFLFFSLNFASFAVNSTLLDNRNYRIVEKLQRIKNIERKWKKMLGLKVKEEIRRSSTTPKNVLGVLTNITLKLQWSEVCL